MVSIELAFKLSLLLALDFALKVNVDINLNRSRKWSFMKCNWSASSPTVFCINRLRVGDKCELLRGDPKIKLESPLRVGDWLHRN